jgi:pyruvate ferredoxin oxidoreductase gamma subunit
VVSAATILAQAALDEGKHIQTFPEFGPERSGAPIRAYNRFSDEPITVHSQVTEPDIVVVMDPTLLRVEDVSEGAKDDAIFVVNCALAPQALAPLVCSHAGQTVYTVDASKIALEETGKNFPDTALVGAVAQAGRISGPQAILKYVRASLQGKVSDETLEGNLRAVRRGWCEAGRAVAATVNPRRPAEMAAGRDWQDLPIGGVVAEAGSAQRYHTGAWRTMRPILDAAKCNDCLLCWLFCPDSAVRVEGGKMLGFDLEHCKGCGICAEVCPPRIKAITMVAETQEL